MGGGDVVSLYQQMILGAHIRKKKKRKKKIKLSIIVDYLYTRSHYFIIIGMDFLKW